MLLAGLGKFRTFPNIDLNLLLLRIHLRQHLNQLRNQLLRNTYYPIRITNEPISGMYDSVNGIIMKSNRYIELDREALTKHCQARITQTVL